MRSVLVGIATATLALQALGQASEVDRYNVVWESPSRDASGSMPIGNGETGLNVWVEEGGDLLFYMSRTDAWSEIDRLLKLGRVRLTLSPNPFEKGLPFRQELRLRDGRIEITAGEPNEQARLRIYVNPLGSDIRVDGEFDKPIGAVVALENWRTTRKTFEDDTELQSSWTMHSAPASVRNDLVWESADVVGADGDGVLWYHRNEHSVVPFTLKHQGLESIADQFSDPLLHRTFGGRMSGRPLTPDPTRPGVIRTSSPTKSLSIRITTHSARAESVEAWRAEVARLDTTVAGPDATMQSTAAWWHEFWERSWIFVSGEPAPTPLKAGPAPKNPHPLRIGADSNNQNVFRGTMPSVAIYDNSLTAEQIAARPDEPGAPAAWWRWEPKGGRRAALPPQPSRTLSLQPVGNAREGMPMPDGPALMFEGGHFEIPATEIPEFSRGFSLVATISREGVPGAARLFDKMTAGGSDGFIFDTHPGDALRLIVGNQTLHATGILKDAGWHQVAATYDAKSGRMALYLDRKLVKESPAAIVESQPPSYLTRAYVLQRWVSACGGRRVSGDQSFPIKFNGSIFTVEPVHTQGQKFNADWRKWGGCFWWQNTRLPYYPMLAAGDFDSMDPLFSFYEAAVSGSKARASLYHGVDGVYFPETMTTFGAYGNGDYGWNRDGAKPSDVHCPWWQYAWQQGLELAQLMLDYAAYSGDTDFLRNRAIPFANEALKYYDTRFSRDSAGKLRITPTQAVETYWYEVVNDAPSIGGLHSVCDALLALPPSAASETDHEFWQRMKKATPTLPVWSPKGKPAAAPAEVFKNQRNNCETAELYPLFPFRCYGLGRPNLELAINAYEARVDRSTVGWTQDGMFAAMLGMREEASANLIAKASNSHENFRFPTMWGPNFDWLPDQDHGSNLMTTLQLMLLQCDGDAIRILPSWPRDWDVSFKLHALKQTTIEVVYRGGKIERLSVMPESRRTDLVMPDLK